MILQIYFKRYKIRPGKTLFFRGLLFDFQVLHSERESRLAAAFLFQAVAFFAAGLGLSAFLD